MRHRHISPLPPRTRGSGGWGRPGRAATTVAFAALILAGCSEPAADQQAIRPAVAAPRSTTASTPAILDRPSSTAKTSFSQQPLTDSTTLIPPAPSATASFKYTVAVQVPKNSTDTIHAGCPAGWYVRPGTPDYYTRTSPTAAFTDTTNTVWVAHYETDDSVSGTIANPHNGNLFTNLSATFHNSSLHESHGASISYWCDAVPSWYTTASAARRNSNPTPRTSKKVGNIPSNCYYCLFNLQLINSGTGLALDPSSASAGNPVTANTADSAGNQNWYLQGSPGGSDFQAGLATFGLWQDPGGIELKTAIAVPDGQDPVWASASAGDPPTGGRFYFIDRGAGQINGSVQLISTSTQQCLASPSAAGSAATMEPCDTTDATQWWYDKNPA